MSTEVIYSQHDGETIDGKTGHFVIRHRNVTLRHCNIVSPSDVPRRSPTRPNELGDCAVCCQSGRRRAH